MKKRGINKKSQAEIISTILIILIILISIVIVWNVVYFIINNSSSKISADAFTTSFDVPSTKLYITGGAQVQVHRGTGKGAISGLTFIFHKKSGETKTITKNTNLPTELETKTYDFSSAEVPFNNTDIAKISVVPVFGSNTGIQSEETTTYQRDSSGNRILDINQSSGLVSWWKFDGNMQDSVGGNHGTCTSCPTLTTDNKGNSNSAYNFDGSTSISMGNPQILNTVNGNYTISVWITRNDASDTGKMPISKYNGNLNGFLMQTGSENMFGYFGNGASLPGVSFGLINNIGQWYHLVLIKNLTTISTYAEGNPITLQLLNGFSPADTTNLIIGGLANYDNRYFNGSIDNIMIFNKSLSSSEIQALYNNQK